MLNEFLDRLEKLKSHYVKNPNRVYSKDTNTRKKIEANALKEQFEKHFGINRNTYTKDQVTLALQIQEKFNRTYNNLIEIIDKNMGLTKVEFLKLASATINYNYSGDSLKLNSFLDAINLLESMAEDNDNKTLLVSFVKTRLEGKARDYIPDNCDKIVNITQILKEKCKPESSKIVEGRMLALRVDRSSLQDFARKAEELSEAFRRALVVEGIPLQKAEELTVEKTVELCRSNTNSDLVKSVLASSRFESSKLVIAKLITESNLEAKEKQVLTYRSNKNKNHFNRNANNNKNSHSNDNSNQNNYKGWNKNNNKFRKGGYKYQNQPNRSYNQKGVKAFGPENDPAPQQSRLGETLDQN